MDKSTQPGPGERAESFPAVSPRRAAAGRALAGAALLACVTLGTGCSVTLYGLSEQKMPPRRVAAAAPPVCPTAPVPVLTLASAQAPGPAPVPVPPAPAPAAAPGDPPPIAPAPQPAP